jgi:hypothetical protein
MPAHRNALRGRVTGTGRSYRPGILTAARTCPARVALAILVTLCGALGPWRGSAGADTLIGATEQPTPVSAYGEVVTWSASEGDAYRLMVKVGSAVRAVPTAPEPRAFDASVGLDPSKDPVVLFSRCRHYNSNPSALLFGGSASGCRIYQYDVDRGVVLPMALGQRPSDSFTFPSQWESHVAVVASTRAHQSRIETISLPSNRRSILPGPTLRHGRVNSLRIVGGRVAATWYSDQGLETEVVLDTLGGTREILEEGEQGAHADPQIPNPTGPEFFGAGLTDEEAYWVEPGDPLIGTPAVVEFYNPLTQTSTVGEGVPDVFSVAPDGTTLYYSTGSNAGGCPCGIFEQ